MAMLRTQRSSDVFWMQRALRLAASMRGHVWPNPPVGCVIVKNDRSIAETATHPGGRPHAEQKALEAAGASANGATLYVTLEPCCHWGKTPPCVDAIIEASVSRVVSAIQDPDPRVNGGGFARLLEAGLDVTVGVCAEEAQSLMSGFFHRVRHGVPELVVVDKVSDSIPDGVDAVLAPSHHGRRIVTRWGEIDILGISNEQLLERMSAFGLTSVAVQAHDPILIETLTKKLVG